MTDQELIKNYISKWSTEKLIDVALFNAAGKMIFTNPCGCLLGVGSTIGKLHHLHECEGNSTHYIDEHAIHGDVEQAYQNLGDPGGCYLKVRDRVRKEAFAKIIGEALTERGVSM